MTSRERMACAMRPRAGVLPDKVPVMCQLALGHYFLRAGTDPVEIWHDSQAFGDALLELQRRYRFDGILVNLPGREPGWRARVRAIARTDDGTVVQWICRRYSVVPLDDNAHVHGEGGDGTLAPRFEEVVPDELFYVEPHDLCGLTYPTRWSCDGPTAQPGPTFFPPWYWDTLKYVRSKAPDISVHGEVFSPFSQFMELLGPTQALMALMRNPAKTVACLTRLAEGAIVAALGHLEEGADAVLMSSAFAGAGFLSRDHYCRFVLPHEQQVIRGVKHAFPSRPIYTHTCGAIGDRLDLMEKTETDGIDTLDPPPLGTVDLADARRRLGARVFIKGNIDPVNTVLLGTEAGCRAAARERLEATRPGSGFILSTACSVPPHAPPENIAALVQSRDEWGPCGS
jgi:hypothetical protein